MSAVTCLNKSKNYRRVFSYSYSMSYRYHIYIYESKCLFFVLILSKMSYKSKILKIYCMKFILYNLESFYNYAWELFKSIHYQGTDKYESINKGQTETQTTWMSVHEQLFFLYMFQKMRCSCFGLKLTSMAMQHSVLITTFPLQNVQRATT